MRQASDARSRRRSRTLASVGWVAVAAVAAHAGPALTSFRPLRRSLTPRLAGVGRPGHVALTFDDGPDVESTPRVVRLLEARDVQATFFLLGSMLVRRPSLGRDLVAAGHEVAVHGWRHDCLLYRGPRATYDDLARAYDLITDTCGTPPLWYRPPYGVLTTPALWAARRLGLTPVTWTSWGCDWTASSTAASVLASVERRLEGGGTVLLHDADCTSAPEAWRSTCAALPTLIDHVRERGLSIGPLRDHGIAAVRS